MGYSGIGALVSSGMDVYVLYLLVPGNLIIVGGLELVIFLQLTLKLSMNPLISFQGELPLDSEYHFSFNIFLKNPLAKDLSWK